MSIKAILFDLDGTLLPMDQDVFVQSYFKLLAARMAPFGYEPTKLVESIWAGTAAMIRNDGSRSNEQAFWDKFTELYGPDALKDKPTIDAFYSNEFNGAKEVCGFAPMARTVIDRVKASGRLAVLATNPIFPAVATENRIRWAGLSPEDFALYTTYENSSYCKPNPKYFAEILDKLGLQPEECVMVGNDATEDLAAAKLGIPVFLLTDCLINKSGKDISQYPSGGFDALDAYLAAL